MITTRGRYALRFLIDLAALEADQLTSLESVGERQDISKKYLESIARDLVREGLVKGSRGKYGGYQLAEKPEEITIWRILQSAQPDLGPVACLKANAAPCARSGSCRTLPVWKQYQKLSEQFFSSITLAQAADGEVPDFVLSFPENSIKKTPE